MSYDTNINTPDIDQGVIPGAILNDPEQPFTASLIGEWSRFSLRVREDEAPMFCEATSLSLPSTIGSVHSEGETKILCLGPDEWLIISAPDSALTIMRKCYSYTASPFSLVDISHRNIAFRISGEGAAQFINMGCALDLGLSAFPEGKCARTIFERAEVILYREAETAFQVELWRSFAPYFLSLLEKGRQFE